MTPWLVDVPQPREAPESVRRALRALDPSAEVLSLSPATWVVGRVRKTDDSVRIATAMLRHYWAMAPKARGTLRSLRRYRLALAGLQGFRPVQQYQLRELDDRVVQDFAEGQWRMQHQRGDLLDEWERAEDEAKAQRRALLGDEHAAKDVVDYTTKTTFGYAVSSVGRTTDTRSSARTLHRAS